MAAIVTGLGGAQGVGEGSFRGTTLNAANGGTGNYDDGSLKVNITSVFGPAGINYFGTNYTSIYINTNGLITFAAPVVAYTPTSLSALPYPAIAAFWSDVNITSGSATGSNNIYWDLDPISKKVTITWLGVKPYSGSGTNTFQVVIEATHDGNFEIDFIYQQVQWTNGFAGIAQTGMTDGGSNDYVFPGSGNAAALKNFPTASLDPSDPNGTWSTRFLNGVPVCFEAGTLIDTPLGPRAVEDLRAGDLVQTQDAGAQPLRWVGGGSVMASEAALPVQIAAGVLDNDSPHSVSGQHLLTLSGADCELLFGEAEVLAAAKDLVALDGITQEIRPRAVRYFHLLLDQHHLLRANGTLAESLHPGPLALAHLPARARADLVTRFLPYDLARMGRQSTARRVLKAHEAQVLVARWGGAAAVPLRPVFTRKAA